MVPVNHKKSLVKEIKLIFRLQKLDEVVSHLSNENDFLSILHKRKG